MRSDTRTVTRSIMFLALSSGGAFCRRRAPIRDFGKPATNSDVMLSTAPGHTRHWAKAFALGILHALGLIGRQQVKDGGV